MGKASSAKRAARQVDEAVPETVPCAQCGAANRPDAEACYHCATPKDQQEQILADRAKALQTDLVCPCCGATNPHDFSFCWSCLTPRGVLEENHGKPKKLSGGAVVSPTKSKAKSPKKKSARKK